MFKSQEKKIHKVGILKQSAIYIIFQNYNKFSKETNFLNIKIIKTLIKFLFRLPTIKTLSVEN